MVTNEAARQDAIFSALADPTRRAILDAVRRGEQGAGELAERFPVSRPAIARHVRVLRRAGLLHVRRDAQRRFYSLRPAALAEVDRWLEPYRLFWAARLVGLKAFAERPDNDNNEGNTS